MIDTRPGFSAGPQLPPKTEKDNPHDHSHHATC